jgi:hypothetical protein
VWRGAEHDQIFDRRFDDLHDRQHSEIHGIIWETAKSQEMLGNPIARPDCQS